jgi:hypothetical protein
MTEKSKLSTLQAKEKVAYIWEYYKLFIIIFVCACAFIIYMAGLMRSAVKDYRFYATMVGTNADVGNDSGFYEGYLEYTGFDSTDEPVYFNSASYFDYSKDQGFGNTYYELVVTYIEAGVLDTLIMETEDLASFGESGRLLDLDKEECSSIREKYGQYFIYCTPYDEEYGDGEQVAVGIDISDSILATEYDIYEGGSCALGIGEYSHHLDAVEMFLDYIFEEGQNGK